MRGAVGASRGGCRGRPRERARPPAPRPRPVAPTRRRKTTVPTARPAARLTSPFRRRARPLSHATRSRQSLARPGLGGAGAKVGQAKIASPPRRGCSQVSPPLPEEAPPASCHAPPSSASNGSP